MSNSAFCPAVVDTADPKKKPNKKLISISDNRRQGFRNHSLKLLKIVSNRLFKRVFCMGIGNRKSRFDLMKLDNLFWRT
jgi:hypothetical protein